MCSGHQEVVLVIVLANINGRAFDCLSVPAVSCNNETSVEEFLLEMTTLTASNTDNGDGILSMVSTNISFRVLAVVISFTLEARVSCQLFPFLIVHLKIVNVSPIFSTCLRISMNLLATTFPDAMALCSSQLPNKVWPKLMRRYSISMVLF